MIISDKLKCVFLHINKSGGTSIDNALKKYITVRSKSSDTAITARQVAGKKWDKYFTFAIVRNPWSKMVSLWLYRRKIGKIKRIGFDEFLRKVDTLYDHKSPKEKRLVLFRTRDQLNSCVDEKGNIILDYIGRLEQIDKSWNHICSKFGKKLRLPHSKKTRHNHYSTYYSEEMIDLVRGRFSKDIEYFGYTFEDRRNA